MSNTVIKTIEIQHPTVNIAGDIGAEAQNITVSRDASGTIITDIETEIVDSTESLAETLKNEEAPFTGATSLLDGTKGLVPKPLAGDENKCLFGDATWRESISGSSITITSLEASLNGKQVSITDGTHTKTGTFDSSGICTITGITFVGNLTITSTDGTDTATKIVNMPYFGVYSTTLSFWSATVNITGSDQLKGALVTVKNSSDVTVGTVTLSSTDATGVFVASEADTYKFNFTYSGKNYSEELEITAQTTYNLSLSVGFDWKEWVDSSRTLHSTDYNSLSEVLVDEEALRQLFLVHDCVDYLAEVTSANADIQTIINTDLAAKWINLSDYALDTLYANTIIKGYMDTADKYFYGEWALVGQVPKMTSNTAPYGTAVSSSEYSGYPAWKVFDGDSNTRWNSNNISTNQYVGYQFPTAVKIDCVIFEPLFTSNTLYVKNWKIQASNDRTDWVDLASGVFNNEDVGRVKVELNNSNAYTYYILRVEDSYGTVCAVGTLQFYAWAPKGNVPVMTANTAPYGTASATSARNATYAAYCAFNDDRSAYWIAGTSVAINTSSVGGLDYKFTNPICVKRFLFEGMTASFPTTELVLNGSNDGSTWTAIQTYTSEDLGDGFQKYYLDVDNDSYYLYYRLAVRQTNNYNTATDIPRVMRLQYYGRELSDLVPPMISDTLPSGECVASSVGSGSRYYVFDKDATTGHMSTQSDTNNNYYIGYKFPKPTVIKGVSILANSYSASYYYDNALYGGNDLSSLTKLSENLRNQAAVSSPVQKSAMFENDNAYTYYVVKIVASNASNPNNANCDNQINEISLFGKDYSEKEFEEGTNKKWLYDHGVELETIESYTYGNNSRVTKETSEIEVYIPASTISMAFAYFRQDLTDYSMLFLKAGSKFIGATALSVYNALPSSVGAPDRTYVLVSNSSGVVSNLVSGVDTSSLNEIDYVGLSISTTSTTGTQEKGTLKELWLE